MQFGATSLNGGNQKTTCVAFDSGIETAGSRPLFVSVCDPASGQIIRGQFNADSITSQNANKVLSHLSGNLCKNHVLGSLELHFEEGVRQFVYDDPLSRNKIFFGQACLSCLLTKNRAALFQARTI